jgi:aspartyl-tRNA(Asn)/glutamyl-tRNA(Gln) amidotransferase subunit B
VSWEIVIGLEVHCQLATRTKLFCGCPNEFGAAPNANACPVCTGQPGALPVLNDGAIALALRAAVAVDAEVAERSTFARKNYFYCDLPKGYQITQYDRPYCSGGGITLASGKRVRLVRIHLEEDAGKAIHDRGDTTLVDLNRAGVPLIESVTEPDLSNADEAYEYLVELRERFLFAGVSDCDMEKGSLRCDVNVSVRRPGEPLGEKVELKNLNSFRNVKAAIEVERARQVALLEHGGAVVQETRTFDPDRGETRTMRTKEDAEDYRYFPEPDLPELALDAAEIERARAALPELASAKRARYVGALGLSEYDAGVLTADPATAAFFEATAAAAGDAKAAANWVANEVAALLSGGEVDARTVADLRVAPAELAALIGLVGGGSLSSTAAKRVLRHMASEGVGARAAAKALGLEQVNDAGEIEAWVRAAMEGREAVVADLRAGKTKAMGALIGPVMQASGGRANPALVREVILRLAAGDV